MSRKNTTLVCGMVSECFSSAADRRNDPTIQRQPYGSWKRCLLVAATITNLLCQRVLFFCLSLKQLYKMLANLTNIALLSVLSAKTH